jgi:hypothetical protein
MICQRSCDAYERLQRERALAELFEDSDCNVVFSDAVGTAKSLPVVLKKSTLAADGSGESYVLFEGKYVRPQSLPGFQKIELKPEHWPKPESKPTTHAELVRANEQAVLDYRAARQAEHRTQNGIGDRQSKWERLAEMERQIISDAVRARLDARSRKF